MHAPTTTPPTPSSTLGRSGPRVRDSALLRMLARFLAPYRRGLVGVTVLLLLVSGLTLVLPLIIRQAVDGPIQQRQLSALWPYAITYLTILVVLFVVRFVQTLWLQTIGQNALATLRQTLFDHVLRQDMAFFNRTPVGQLVSRLSSDVEALTELLSTSIVVVASNMLTLVGIVIVMLLLNARLALVALAVLPIMIGVTAFFRGRIRRASDDVHHLIGQMQATLNEHINGMAVVQLFGREQAAAATLDEINTQHRATFVHLRDHYTGFAASLQALSAMAVALVLLQGASGALAAPPWVTLGTLIAFVDYTRRITQPIMALAEQFTQIQTALSAGARIARLLDVQPDLADPPAPQSPPLHGDVRLEHVTFAYEPGHPVLHDLTLHIPPGQRVAVVGATGAGKSSLVGLLARTYDTQQGAVVVNGVDVRQQARAALRQAVTVVPQTPYCFHGTIAENLHLFDAALTPAQVEQAARTAHAHPFIARLPGRYDFVLQPGGANLSQGQRQLLALARALLHSPHSILVLDEATSSIDTETEALIQSGLDEVLRGRTSVVIAHRLSTVRNADRILVMRDGRIIEDGPHDDLLARGGVYAELYARQFAEV